MQGTKDKDLDPPTSFKYSLKSIQQPQTIPLPWTPYQSPQLKLVLVSKTLFTTHLYFLKSIQQTQTIPSPLGSIFCSMTLEEDFNFTKDQDRSWDPWPPNASRHIIMDMKSCQSSETFDNQVQRSENKLKPKEKKKPLIQQRPTQESPFRPILITNPNL